MKRSPELMLGIVVVILLIVGIVAYVVAAPHAHAPTTATSTPITSTTTTTTTTTTTSSGSTTYTDPGHTFTFNYPSQFNLSGGDGTYVQDWMVNSTSDGLLLTKITMPQSFEPNTNFGDANLTVGTSPKPAAVASCLAAPTSGSPIQSSIVTINGTVYHKFVSSDAGAGNLYETTSYRTIRNSQCYVIEYTIHSGNIQNYPTGTVSAFDEAKVKNVLDGIVSSFTFLS